MKNILHCHILSYIGRNQAAPTSDIMRDNILGRREVLAVCRALERRGFIFKDEDSWGSTQRRSGDGTPTSGGKYADVMWVVNCEPNGAAFMLGGDASPALVFPSGDCDEVVTKADLYERVKRLIREIRGCGDRAAQEVV